MSNTLRNGQWLLPGQSLKSDNGNTELCVQSDGKLAFYQYGNCIFQNTAEQREDIKGLKMQEDGNLCLHTTRGDIIWHTETAYPRGDSSVYCIVQDDGNIVLYKSNGSPIWASDTREGTYSGGGSVNSHHR
ncbi:hypothetical protein AtubIFM57258_005131 [Aspergillus tubingensis]|nr:hypothetical protein AtubIFM57258_005131 [Aspergillus tubingensis]